MADSMPKEQFEFISNIQADLLESTNLTKEDAWRFGFLCWQNGYAKAEYGNGWIPCSERLPGEKGAVLVTYTNVNDDVRVEVTMYEPKRKSFWVSPYVIAWMPLPEAYKPEKGE